MRVIGLDVHRSFAVVAILEDTLLSNGGRVELTRNAVVAFGRKLRPDDEVVIEATGNTSMIVRLLRPFVQRVVIANPLQVRAIAHAKIKTDKIDAAVLAKLHAAAFCLRSGCRTKRLRPYGVLWRSGLRSSNR
jgi:transposase